MTKHRIKNKRLREEFEFVKKAKQFFGINSSSNNSEVIEPQSPSQPAPLSQKEVADIRKKVSSAVFLACSQLKLYELPLIYYNFYGLHKFNSLYYRDQLGNQQKGSHYFLDQVSNSLRDYEEKDMLDRSLAERIEGVLSFIVSDVTKLIDDENIDLLKDNPDEEELISLIKQNGKHPDKVRDLLYYNEKLIYKKNSQGKGYTEELSVINRLKESRNNESYLYRLFEEDEVPSTPVKREAPQVQSPDKLSDDDIDILGDELSVEQPSAEPEGVSSSSMGMEDILKTVSQWKDEFEKSSILDSFISGADVVENNSERESFQYLTDSQYNDFSKLIDAGRTIATMINDLSYDAEKLLGEIELSRKMMVSEKE